MIRNPPSDGVGVGRQGLDPWIRRWMELGAGVLHVQLVFLVDGLLVELACLPAPRMRMRF